MTEKTVKDWIEERFGSQEAFEEWAEKREELIRKATRDIMEEWTADITEVLRHDNFNIDYAKLELDRDRIRIRVEKYEAPATIMTTPYMYSELKKKRGAFPTPFIFHAEGIVATGITMVTERDGNIVVYDEVEIIIDEPRMTVVEKLIKEKDEIELFYIILPAINLTETILNPHRRDPRKMTEWMRAIRSMIISSARALDLDLDLIKRL